MTTKGTRLRLPSQRSRRAMAWLGVGSALANLVSYAGFLVLNRALSPGDLGAVVALLTVMVLAAVPAMAIQLVSARRVAAATPDQGVVVHRDALHAATIAGALVTGVGLLLTPLGMRLLHLDGPWALVATALSLLPLCLQFAVQGLLQGTERFRALTVVYVATASLRLATIVGALSAGWSVDGILWSVLFGVVLTALTAWATMPQVAFTGHNSAVWLREIATAVPASSALFVASSLDTPLARHLLTPAESGQYAVGSLFAKAAFWGPTFVVIMLFPRMARHGRRRHLAVATGATAVVVVVGVALAWALADPLVALVGGPNYAGAGFLAPLFTGLGGAWALAQVIVHWGIAQGRHHLGHAVLVVVGLATVVVLVADIATIHGIALAFLAAAASFIVAGLALSLARQLPIPSPGGKVE